MSTVPHLTGFDMEQIERADDRASQSHGQRVDRPKAGLDGFEANRGQRSSTVARSSSPRAPRPVAVEARAFLGLKLEQLEHPHGLARRRHHPQAAVGCDQHQAGRGDVEHSTQRSATASTTRRRRSRRRACQPAPRRSWRVSLLLGMNLRSRRASHLRTSLVSVTCRDATAAARRLTMAAVRDRSRRRILVTAWVEAQPPGHHASATSARHGRCRRRRPAAG